MLSNISERDQRTLKYGGIGVGAILLLMVAGFPLMDYWDHLNRDIATDQGKLQAIQTSLGDAAESRKAMRDLQEKTRIHPSVLALNQQTSLMLQQVEALPAYHTLNVQRMEGLPLRDDDKLYRSSVQLQFTGTLRDLHAFLDQAEKSRPTLKVDRLTVTAGHQDRARVEGQMVLTGYAGVMGKGKSG
jgi:hypothetical protein